MAYHQRSNYWANSKFANWVCSTFGGAPKLNCGTAEEWVEWRKKAKTTSPFVYWFNETFLDAAQDFFNWPNDVLCDIRYYLHNRFVSKTHYLHTRLKPGQWHEFDERLLHGAFEEFVDFIEIETAWSHVLWNDEARKKYKLPWWRRGWRAVRWGVWRCPEAGIAHLKWEMELKYDDDWTAKDDPLYGQLTPQAKDAIIKYKLYDWWKNVRPNRPDPADASGWSASCNEREARRKQRCEDSGEDDDDIMMRLCDNNETEEQRECHRQLVNKMNEIEKQYDDEDTEMLVELIKIRHALWT